MKRILDGFVQFVGLLFFNFSAQEIVGEMQGRREYRLLSRCGWLICLTRERGEMRSLFKALWMDWKSYLCVLLACS